MKHSSRYLMVIGFAVMLFLLLLIISIGIGNMTAINERMDKIVSVHNVKTTQMSTLRSIARERSLLFYHMILVRDPFVIDENIQKASNYAGEFIKIRDELFASAGSKAERARLEQMMVKAIASTRIQQQVTELLTQGKFEPASKLFLEKSLPAQSGALAMYDSIIDEQTRLTEAAAQEAKSAYRKTFLFMLILSGIAIALGLFISIYTIRKTTRTENSLQQLNQQLEQRVLDRTLQLSDANQELQKTIDTLRKTQASLVQAEKMASLGNLVAGISHEINTPIGIGVTSATFLKDETQILRRKFESDQMRKSDLSNFINQAEQASDIVYNNLERASKLIQSFKQVAVDQSSDDWRVVEFERYFAEILLSMQPHYKRTAIKLENLADPTLSCYTHPGAIYQIISNLIQNAILHAFEPEQAGNIRIDARKLDEHIEIRCEDNGKGIPAEHLDRIFDPFFTTKRGLGGTGLGLNIVYNLVNTKLGGSIKVNSNEGAGTVFQILLPMRRAGSAA